MPQRTGRTTGFDDLGIWALLGRVGDREQLADFAGGVLGRLLEYDRDRGSDLIHTLRDLARCSYHYRTAADELFAHPNTLRYRVARITELAGLDLADPEDRLRIELALRVLDVLSPPKTRWRRPCRRPTVSSGALDGLEVVELRAKGPAPFATTLLADFGATVVRVDRQAAEPASPGDPFGRGRRDVVLDLKSAAGRDAMLGLVERADVLIEAYRPGVAERLGIGPDECMARNPRLVYARMTGWGQDGPLAQQAGHDLNFLALTGALHALGSADRPPPPPLNLVGDFGGGALYLVVGILLALHERARSGRGQVVDAAMVDGVCNLMAPYHHLPRRRRSGRWSARPTSSTAARPSTGPIAARTTASSPWAASSRRCTRSSSRAMGLDPADWPQGDRSRWPSLRRRLEDQFAAEPRTYWATRFAGTDACVNEVLDLGEAVVAPHLVARESFVTVDGVTTPRPRRGSRERQPALRLSYLPDASSARARQSRSMVARSMASRASSPTVRCSAVWISAQSDIGRARMARPSRASSW